MVGALSTASPSRSTPTTARTWPPGSSPPLRLPGRVEAAPKRPPNVNWGDWPWIAGKGDVEHTGLGMLEIQGIALKFVGRICGRLGRHKADKGKRMYFIRWSLARLGNKLQTLCIGDGVDNCLRSHNVHYYTVNGEKEDTTSPFVIS